MDRFKLMETYAKVVQFGNYTRAARELGVTRAMVSKRILDLEAQLGVKLLNRNTHNLSVTATGADYYESCITLLSDLETLEDRMQSKQADPSGTLRILTSKTFGETILASVVAEFSQKHENIAIEMTLGDWHLGAHDLDLISAGYDIAIRTLPTRDSALIARSIIALPRTLVASPGYLKRHGAPKKPIDLLQHNCLDPRGTNHYTWELTGPKGSETVRVSGTPRINSNIANRRAALTDLGIAMLSEYLVADDLKAGRLERVLKSYSAPTRPLYIIYQKDNFQPLRMRMFIDFLVQEMKSFSERQKFFAHPDFQEENK